MIKIGYLGRNHALELLEETQPTNVAKELTGKVKRCPSVRGYDMNTFEVKCPFDAEWTITKSDTDNIVCDFNPDHTTVAVDNKVLEFDVDSGVVQINIRPQWSFVSDTPGTILLQHSNGIDTNPPIISGMFDIYNWPDRTLSIGYKITSNPQTFRLKRGEPWYRVTIITPELQPVNLVKMEERPPFLERTKNKHHLAAVHYLNWRKVFKYFGKTRPKKLINA